MCPIAQPTQIQAHAMRGNSLIVVVQTEYITYRQVA